MKSPTNNGKTKKQFPNERKGGSLRKNANWKEASQLSDTKFKAIVIRKLTELTDNYNELTANYINMTKEIETINKGQEEMKNTICLLYTSDAADDNRLV